MLQDLGRAREQRDARSRGRNLLPRLVDVDGTTTVAQHKRQREATYPRTAVRVPTVSTNGSRMTTRGTPPHHIATRNFGLLPANGRSADIVIPESWDGQQKEEVGKALTGARVPENCAFNGTRSQQLQK